MDWIYRLLLNRFESISTSFEYYWLVLFWHKTYIYQFLGDKWANVGKTFWWVRIRRSVLMFVAHIYHLLSNFYNDRSITKTFQWISNSFNHNRLSFLWSRTYIYHRSKSLGDKWAKIGATFLCLTIRRSALLYAAYIYHLVS